MHRFYKAAANLYKVSSFFIEDFNVIHVIS